MEPLEYKRGEIYMADLDPVVGSEQGGHRPVLIVQNNTGNRFSPTLITSVITSRKKRYMPTHVHLEGGGLPKDSMLLAEHIKTLDETRLGEQVGKLSIPLMAEVDAAIKISLGLNGTGQSNIWLCPHCADLFYHSDCFYIQRIDRYPVRRTQCEFCKQHRGFAYTVTFKIHR